MEIIGETNSRNTEKKICFQNIALKNKVLSYFFEFVLLALILSIKVMVIHTAAENKRLQVFSKILLI